MRSQLDDESDDEYFDDPIKLFDFEQEKVHYSSQSFVYGNSSNDGICQSNSNLTGKSNAVFLELPDNDSEELSENDCLPVSVKLVDCKKFPWYFKKYTQQILNKANIYDLVSDSDNEVDVEHVRDNNDNCVVSGNINSEFKNTNEFATIYSLEKSSEVVHKTKAQKRLENMKRREDVEIQMALHRKNMEEIDFKRNKGLVGMTITQKVVKNMGLDVTVHQNMTINGKRVKQNEVLPDQSYIRAAEKILSNVGTELLHVCANTQKPVTTEEIGTDDSKKNKNLISKSGNLRSKEQFNLLKISKKILHCITTNKSSDKMQVGNQERIEWNNTTKEITLGPNLNTSLESLSSPSEVKSSSKHVRNIKKTNKYKNNHVKAIEKMILEKEALELAKEKNIKHNTIILGTNTNSTHSPHKTVETGICEPNSPILHCNTSTKRNKEVNEDCKNGTTTKTNNSGCLLDKQKTTYDSNGIENKSKGSHQVINNNTTPELSRELQKTCIKLHHRNEKIAQIIEREGRATTEEAIENNNETCDDILTKSNQNPVIQNFIPASQDNHNNMSIQIVSVESIAPSSKTTNADKTAPPSDIESTIQNKPVSAINEYDGMPHYNNGVKPHSFIENNSVGGTIVDDSQCNQNVTNVYNPYASAIILKSNQPSISHNQVQYKQPSFNEPPTISGPNQPRFYQNSYPNNYQDMWCKPPHFGLDQRFIPRSANSSIPNFRLPPPYENRYQTQYNSVQSQPLFNGRQLPNILPKKASRGAWPRKNVPCRFPVQMLPKLWPQDPHEASGTKFGDVYLPENHPQSQSKPQPDNITTSKNILEPKNMPQPNNVIQSNNIPHPNNIIQLKNTPQPKDIHKLNNILQPMNTSQPSNIPQPSNILQPNNVSQPANCSVIGSNNTGLVKKIKIDSKFLSQDTEKQLDKLSSYDGVLELNNGNVELITSKNSMLEILDSATNILKRAGTDIIGVDEKSAQAFKKTRVSNNLQITSADDNCEKKERQKGYSDPILPIPTYENMMGRTHNLHEKEEPRNNSDCHKNLGNDKKYNEKWHKRALSHKPNGTAKKEDIKKISLEEYKNRTAKKAHKYVIKKIRNMIENS